MNQGATNPRLAEGVWIGPFDVDLPQPSYLARLADGRFFRITESLYQLLSCIDGTRSEEQIARAVSRLWRRHVTRWEVEWILENRLRPRGLVAGHEGQTEDEGPPGMDPVPERFFASVADGWHVCLDGSSLRPITSVLQVLFARPVAAAVLVAVLAMLVRLLVLDGLPEVAQALQSLSWLDILVVSVLVPLFVFLHELGHLAACRRFAGAHGDVVGMPPSFWSADVTEAWRLPRAQRCVVDVGGVYLQLLGAAAAYAIYAGTGWSAALAVALFLALSAAWPLPAGHRTDGWWLVTDALGLVKLDDDEAWEAFVERVDSVVAPDTMDPAAQGWTGWGRLWWALLWLAGQAIAQFVLLGLVVCLVMQYPQTVTQWWSGTTAAAGAGKVWTALAGFAPVLVLPAVLVWTWVFESTFVRAWRRYGEQMRLYLATALWAAARHLQARPAGG